MRCSACGFENARGIKFCGDCGASLNIRCSSCGSENAPAIKFCGECGAALAKAAKVSAQPDPRSYTPKHLAEKILTSRSVLEGERKTITALFADIKGSMELIENLDPEDARSIIDPALELMIHSVHHYEGYVTQSTGDGIFALFGAPIAHEDHSQRALHAALHMQGEVRRYAEQLRAEKGVNLEIRVGINTGDVVVRSIRKDDLHTDYVPIGHSTGLAARMQTIAPAGSIAVTDAVRRLCEGYFTFRSLGVTEVKGVHGPVEVFEATGLGPLRTRLEHAANRGLTKFVGREAERAQMHRALELAKNGRGQIVTVIAEPGVGKSRLVYEFKAVLPVEWKVLEAHSLSHGKASAWLPVLELLRGYFGIRDVDDPVMRREKIRTALAGLDPALSDTLPYLFALLAIPDTPDPLALMDPQIRRRRTLDAIKRTILRESLKQPVVLIFEDLHWIDGQTQALLDFLVDGIANSRTLLLLTYRPEYRHEWGNKSYYSQIRLDALDRESVTELLATLLGQGADFSPLQQLIAERGEGNPFFIEELVRALFEAGVLVRNGGVTMTRSLSQLDLPPTVKGILASRIDRLPPEHKQLLQTLAVIGRQSPFSLIKHLESTAEPHLALILADLQAGEFIYEQLSPPEGEYVFKHALTQEVAYDSLLIERRKLLHEADRRSNRSSARGPAE